MNVASQILLTIILGLSLAASSVQATPTPAQTEQAPSSAAKTATR